MALPFEMALNIAKRLRNPFMAKKADNLVEESSQLVSGAGDALRSIQPGETSHAWLRRGEDTTLPFYQRIIDDFHTPEMVLGRDPNGQAIIDSATKWDLLANKETEPIMSQYSRLSTLIGKGSKDDELIFKALEDPKAAGLLTPRARSMYDFMKSNYDFTAQRRIEHLAGDPESANKILRLASKAEMSEAELKGLSTGQIEALDFARRLRTNYAPHVFDKEKLIELFSQKVNMFASKMAETKVPSRKEWYAKQVKEYEDSVKKLMGGDPLTWETLPKEFAFQHQKIRKGQDQYVNSARQSFESYMNNWKESIFDNEAIKEMTFHYDGLQKAYPALLPYAKWFIREFAGYNTKTAWDKVAGNIAGWQYIRTLGLNPRSAVMNLTQGINTLIDANPVWTAKGYMNMWTPKLKELWKQTGLAGEIPHVLSPETAPYMTRLERLKRVTGFMFRIAEEFNRKHAFSTYFTKGLEKLNLSEEDAIQYAIKGVHKSQFQYGRVGMPKALRTPAGKVFGQFTSFSIKQFEYLTRIAKEDPKKFLYWMGATYGGNAAAQNILGIDLSNALGFPINLAEGLDMLKSGTRGDFDEMFAHGNVLFEGGTGILPSGPGGPTYSSIKDVAKALQEGKPEDLLKQITPAYVQLERAANFLHAIKKRKETGEWGTYKNREELLAKSSAGEAIMDVIGPKPYARTKQSNEWYKQQVFDRLEMNRKREIADAIVLGKSARAEKLIQRYGIIPSEEMLQEAMLKRVLPREMRAKWIKSGLRQQVREANE